MLCAGDLVAHIKFTVLLMPNGSDRVTSHSLQELQPSKSIEDNAEIKGWLALGTKTKKKGGGKKKKGWSCYHHAAVFSCSLLYAVAKLSVARLLSSVVLSTYTQLPFLTLIGKKGDVAEAEPMEVTKDAPSRNNPDIFLNCFLCFCTCPFAASDCLILHSVVEI